MDDLIRTVLDRVLAIDPGGIVGVYLYGSSTSTGLGPESDVDLLLVTRRSLTPQDRASLISTLLGLSGWKGHAEAFPEVASRRPLEVTSLVTADLKPLVAAPWRDFQFGE
ncbi:MULTISPECIES: nucleotidyltransferase domain-containing protein [unclassified Brevibacterium]|nr:MULTISPECIES: nucleotidyltransferase domain-containing protein [unclassified Brevibacterium]